jgi:hypothetical protein
MSLENMAENEYWVSVVAVVNFLKHLHIPFSHYRTHGEKEKTPLFRL